MLFLSVTYWKEFANFIIRVTGTDALNIIFLLSWITLFLGIIGITSKRDSKSILRGTVTILITFGLSGMLTIMILLNKSLF